MSKVDRKRLEKVRRRYRRVLFRGVLSNQVSLDEVENLMLRNSVRMFRIAARLPKDLDAASASRREAV